jgi:hypothetical protein
LMFPVTAGRPGLAVLRRPPTLHPLGESIQGLAWIEDSASARRAGRVKGRLAPSPRTLWVSIPDSRCRLLDSIRARWRTGQRTSAATHPSPPA